MRRNITIVFCLALALGVGVAVPAQQAPAAQAPTHLTLEAAVHEALEANPGLKALSHRAAAAKRDAGATARTRWGEIDAVGWYSRYHDDQIVRPMAREFLAGGFGAFPFDRNQVHYGVTFQVPLYLGGKLSSGIAVSRLEAEKTAALLEGTRWQIRFNVTSLYAAAQTLDLVQQALDRQIAALEKTKEKLDLMVESGKRPEIDRLKVVESLEDARAQRAEAAAQRTKVGAILLSLLGRDPDAELEVDPLPDRLPQLAETPVALRAALEDTSAVRQARLSAEQAVRGVTVARSSFIPRVFAAGNYMQNTAPSIEDPLDTWEVRLGVSVPLFAGGSRFERLGAAREREQAAREAYEKTRLEISSKLGDPLSSSTAARSRVKAARARVAAGVEAARIEQIRYDTGAGTVEDLLRARAREEGARAALAQARGAVITAGERINSIVEKEAVK